MISNFAEDDFYWTCRTCLKDKRLNGALRYYCNQFSQSNSLIKNSEEGVDKKATNPTGLRARSHPR